MRLFSAGLFFFFFSSRRRHTRSLRDWSSDVCSSDLRKCLGDPVVPVGWGTWSHWIAKALATTAGRGGSRKWGGPSANQIGRASCRERVEISVVARSVNKRRMYYENGTERGRERDVID